MTPFVQWSASHDLRHRPDRPTSPRARRARRTRRRLAVPVAGASALAATIAAVLVTTLPS